MVNYKRKKWILWLIGFVLIILAFLCWFLHELFWEGDRYLGELKDPCNDQYAIAIMHHAQFEATQPLYFVIVKNGSRVGYFKQFEFTNDKMESLSSFEIHCFDNILYITWKNEKIPIIMFDTQSEQLYFLNNEDNNKNRKELFNRISKGDRTLNLE